MSKPVQVKRSEPPLLFSCRLAFFVLTFFANLIIMLLRSNINFGLVCMVKPTHHHVQNQTVTILEIASNSTTSSVFNLTQIPTPSTTISDGTNDHLPKSQEFCQPNTNTSSTIQIPRIEGGDFVWDKGVQANMLAAFFYGYVFTNIIGGLVADRFGGKKSLIASVGSISLLTVLNPIASLYGPDYLFAVRFVQGVTQGAFVPLLTVLAARWAGATERGFLLGITFGGFNVGIFLTNPLCAFICKSLGWEYIFYITGALGILWCLASYFFIFDWPEEHPQISQQELEFLQKHRAVQPGPVNSKKTAVPWRSIVLSGPVNVCHFLHFCMLWGILTITMCTPQFFKEILKLDVRRNGILTSIPFLGMLVVHIFSGSLFDSLRRRHWFSVTNLRKIFNTIGTASFAICVPLMSLISCTDNTVEIVSIFLGLSFVELAFTGGYLFSVYELAPRFAGLISGISNTFGVLPGFICPVLAAYLTPNGTREEWLLVFYIGAGVVGIGSIVYLIFGSSNLQPWAAIKTEVNVEEAEMEVLQTKLVSAVDTIVNEER